MRRFAWFSLASLALVAALTGVALAVAAPVRLPAAGRAPPRAR